MLNDPVLLNDWHVVAYAPDLVEGKPIGVRLLEEDLVLWRVGDTIHAWRDLCLHRGTRLSLGRVEHNCLVCPYHGWTYLEIGKTFACPAGAVDLSIGDTQAGKQVACASTMGARLLPLRCARLSRTRRLFAFTRLDGGCFIQAQLYLQTEAPQSCSYAASFTVAFLLSRSRASG